MDLNVLKGKLHQQIDSLQDETALQLLHDAAVEYSKVNSSDILDYLTPEQTERLKASVSQANEGNTLSHAEAMQTLATWRKK